VCARACACMRVSPTLSLIIKNVVIAGTGNALQHFWAWSGSCVSLSLSLWALTVASCISYTLLGKATSWHW